MLMSFSMMAILVPMLGLAGFASPSSEGTVTKQPFGKTADGQAIEL